MNTKAEVSKDSRGVITLRELRNQGNFFAIAYEKWAHIGNEILSQKKPEEALANFLYSTIDGRDQNGFQTSDLMDIFRQALADVRQDIMNEVYRYMPYEWTEQSIIPLPDYRGVADDPISLLREISHIEPGTTLGKVSFEALRAMQMATFYFYIYARHQAWQKMTSHDGAQLIKLFLSWIDPKYQLNKQQLSIEADPDSQWQTVNWRLNPILSKTQKRIKSKYPNSRVIKIEVWEAKFKSIFNNYKVALVEARFKNCFSAFAKSFRAQQGEFWPNLPDMYGIRLIHATQKDFAECLEFIRLKALMDINPKVQKCQVTNKHSQRTMRIKNQRVFVNGRHSEIQHIYFKDWLDGEYSTTTKHHDRYHLRWYIDHDHGIFRHILPKEIYGKDWSDLVIIRELNNDLMEKIRKRNLLISTHQ